MKYLWCERNESSASAHGHTSDCYREIPDTEQQKKGWKLMQRFADEQKALELEVAKDLFQVWGKGADNYHERFHWEDITNEMQSGYLALAKYIIAGGFSKDTF